MITNNQTREAVQELIEKYKDPIIYSNNYGRSSHCSLCILFQMNCSKCPNNVFRGLGYLYDYPCVQRNRKFPALDWGVYQNNKLVIFWSAVYAIIPANGDEFICDQTVQTKILEIANTFKNK